MTERSIRLVRSHCLACGSWDADNQGEHAHTVSGVNHRHPAIKKSELLRRVSPRHRRQARRR